MKTHDLMSFQLATPADYQVIADIYNEHIEIGESTMEEAMMTADDIAGWVSKFNERERLYSLKITGDPSQPAPTIGWGIIKRYSDRKGYRFTCETAVYLAGPECGKGYGSAFKKFIIEECRRLGYHHLVAKIFASNEVSIRYNERLGYTIVGRQNEIGFKNGHWQDVVIMQLVLD